MADSSHTQIPQKNCQGCGKTKPLTAFLQLNSLSGTRYSNICATCRKTQAKMENDSEGTSRTEIKHRIDAKTKIFSDIEKKQFNKDLNDLYHEERKKLSHHLEKKNLQLKSHDEKKNKQVDRGYLKNKFLLDKKNTTSSLAERNKETQQKEGLIKAEKEAREIDLTHQYLPSASSSDLRKEGIHVKALWRLLGTSAPVSRESILKQEKNKTTSLPAQDPKKNNFKRGK